MDEYLAVLVNGTASQPN